MALVAIGQGLFLPQYAGHGNATGLAVGTQKTVDATGERAALIGHCFIEGRAASKTISSSGGKIFWRSGTGNTFANGSTTLDVGIQDVATATGPVARPDETFDVKTTHTGGAFTINNSTWIQSDMTTGTKTISHGDLIAVVLDLTNRAGADAVTWATNSAPAPVASRPVSNVFLAGAWQSSVQSDLPGCYIEFDDGTMGIIQSPFRSMFSISASETYSNATNPDERGLRFTAPWDCKVDGFMFAATDDAADGDMTLELWETPTTAASSMFAINVLGEQLGAGTAHWIWIPFPSEETLNAGTEYGISCRATSTGSVIMRTGTLPDEGLWTFLANTSFSKMTRDGGSGNFTAESPAVTQPFVGLSISQFDDGTGSGSSGGGIRLAGIGGLAAS